MHDLFENGAEVNRDGYLTDLLSERAAEFVARCGREKTPFLLSLHYTAPHWPWETRDDGELAKSFGKGHPIYHLDGGNIHAYRRMIHHMDEGIGRLLATLDDNGIGNDTIVVFTSDNGGERFSDNWPLVGGKMDLMEGGIRVPYVVRWPARAPAGAVTEQLAITMDWVPTFLEAAGASAHPDYPSDGISLVRQLGDPRAVTERPLFWRMKHNEQARNARRPLEVPEGQRARIPVRRGRATSASAPISPGAIPSGCPRCGRPGRNGTGRCRPSRQRPACVWSMARRTCRSRHRTTPNPSATSSISGSCRSAIPSTASRGSSGGKHAGARCRDQPPLRRACSTRRLRASSMPGASRPMARWR